MEKINYHIHGIYDVRTLKYLKSNGLQSFGFDFNPRSLNFVQEYIFLDLFKNTIDDKDLVYLNFVSSRDYMIPKLIEDMKMIKPNLSNVIFVFDEFLDESNFNVNYIVKYNHDLLKSNIENEYCHGMIMDFSVLDEVLSNGKLSNFCTNLVNRFPKILSSNFIFQLNLEWDDNLFSSLFDYIDFNTIQLNLNKEVEICYRNVDLNKFQKELKLKQKYINF